MFFGVYAYIKSIYLSQMQTIYTWSNFRMDAAKISTKIPGWTHPTYQRTVQLQYYVPSSLGSAGYLGDWFTSPRTVNIYFGQVDTWFPPLTSPKPAFYCFLLVGVATVHAENPVDKPVGDGFQTLDWSVLMTNIRTISTTYTPEQLTTRGHLEMDTWKFGVSFWKPSIFNTHSSGSIYVTCIVSCWISVGVTPITINNKIGTTQWNPGPSWHKETQPS